MADDISPAELRAWYRIATTGNIGPVGVRRVLAGSGDIAKAIRKLERGPQPVPIIPDSAAEEALQQLDSLGIKFVPTVAHRYPTPLRMLNDAPLGLFVQGNIDLMARPMVAIVGARTASLSGQRLAMKLAGDLGERGFVVVSGLARGIDGAAHRGALATGTIGVQAGGLDVIYPREHRELHAAIAAEGALISEVPLGTRPSPTHFPRRNRVISGLSLGVVVVEAAERSGSLITARRALEQGREVMAVPGGPGDPRTSGTNRLLRSGATLVESADDVLDVLTPQIAGNGSGHDDPVRYRKTQTEGDSHDGTAAGSMRTDFESGPLTDDRVPEDCLRETVLGALGATPVTVDELVRHCHVSPSDVSAMLLELELEALVERMPGNVVRRIF